MQEGVREGTSEGRRAEPAASPSVTCRVQVVGPGDALPFLRPSESSKRGDQGRTCPRKAMGSGVVPTKLRARHRPWRVAVKVAVTQAAGTVCMHLPPEKAKLGSSRSLPVDGLAWSRP